MSTQVRTLQEEGFIDHKAYGPTYQYFEKVSRDEYTQRSLIELIDKYFDSSYLNAVSTLVKEEKIIVEQLNELRVEMTDFLLYEVKAAMVLLLFYLSFLLPLCVITIHRKVEIGAFTIQPEVSESIGVYALAENSEAWWISALTILFWTGVAFVLVRIGVSVISTTNLHYS